MGFRSWGSTVVHTRVRNVLYTYANQGILSFDYFVLEVVRTGAAAPAQQQPTLFQTTNINLIGHQDAGHRNEEDCRVLHQEYHTRYIIYTKYRYIYTAIPYTPFWMKLTRKYHIACLGGMAQRYGKGGHVYILLFQPIRAPRLSDDEYLIPLCKSFSFT